MSIFNQVAFEIETSLQRILKNPKHKNIFKFLLVPDKIIIFKVNWQDRNGDIRWNTGYRVQFNNSLGPYKGGLRFHKNGNEILAAYFDYGVILINLPISSIMSDRDLTGLILHEMLRQQNYIIGTKNQLSTKQIQKMVRAKPYQL